MRDLNGGIWTGMRIKMLSDHHHGWGIFCGDGKVSVGFWGIEEDMVIEDYKLLYLTIVRLN